VDYANEKKHNKINTKYAQGDIRGKKEELI